MRLLLVVVAGLLAMNSPASACEFKSASGSTITFNETAAHPYVFVDGKRCLDTGDAIVCGKSRVSYSGNPDETLDFKGVHYVSTDNCSAGPE